MTAPDRLPKPYLVRTAVDDILANLEEGDAVPPERELAARFGVSRETVRQALHELLVAGRIERRGRGTVVSRPKLVQPLSSAPTPRAPRSADESRARARHVGGCRRHPGNG